MSHNSQVLQLKHLSSPHSGDALKFVRFESIKGNRKAEFSSVYLRLLGKQQQNRQTAHNVAIQKLNKKPNSNRSTGVKSSAVASGQEVQHGNKLPQAKGIKQTSGGKVTTAQPNGRQTNPQSIEENHIRENLVVAASLKGAMAVRPFYSAGSKDNVYLSAFDNKPNQQRNFSHVSSIDHRAKGLSDLDILAQQEEGNVATRKAEPAQLAQLMDDVVSGDFNSNVVNDSLSVTRQASDSLQSLTPASQMTSAMNNPAWSGEMGQRVMWMFQNDLQQAQLKLNPKHLGPLEIKISLTTDQLVNVSFLTHNVSVKEALDESMPQLRMALEQNGLNLGDVNVQQKSPKVIGEQQSEDGSHSKFSRGIVDFYA